MKTALGSLWVASLLGFASCLGGRDFAAAVVPAFIFATGLVAWTIEQYGRKPRVLAASQSIRLPLQVRPTRAPVAICRVAA